MIEGRTRGQGNNPGVTKRKIIEIVLKQSEWTPEPMIRDSIASDLGIKEPKSTKIQLAAAKEEGLLLKDTKSGVNYWDINFKSDILPGYVTDIITQMDEEKRVPFFSSVYVQELVLKNAGFLAKTNHPKTRMGYNTTHHSEYWGFLHSEPIHETPDEDLYFVGTMGLIVDYSYSDEKYREEFVSFLVENKNDIYGHTSLKNPERLFHNMIQAH